MTLLDAHIREAGVVAIRLRGEVMHPECRTEDERRMTSMFLKEHEGDCARCGKPISEVPADA